MRKILLSFICIWPLILVAQTSFSVDSVQVSSNYPADSPVFYPWIELTNNTGNLLEMRCVKVLDQKPAAWETHLEDLDSAYNYVPDTTTFFLPAINQQAQFLIVSFHPNNTVGRASVTLKLYPASSPNDTVLLTYLGSAYASPIDTTTAINETNSWLPDVTLYPQPSAHALQVSASNLQAVVRLFLIDVLGHKVLTKWTLIDATNIEVSLTDVASGTYLLVMQDEEGNSFTRLIAKQ